MAARKQQSARRSNSSDRKPWTDDEILAELYEFRAKYSAEHGYDLKQIYEDLKRREATSSLRRRASKRATRLRVAG